MVEVDELMSCVIAFIIGALFGAVVILLWSFLAISKDNRD